MWPLSLIEILPDLLETDYQDLVTVFATIASADLFIEMGFR